MRWLLCAVWLLGTLQVFAQPSPDTLWTRAYGGLEYEESHAIQQTPDGGYIVLGNTYSGGATCAYLVRTDANGTTLWTRTYAVNGNVYENALAQTSDGGYLLAGWTASSTTNRICMIKTNSAGDTIWTRLYGDEGTHYIYDIALAEDGGYVLAGAYAAPGSPRDVYLCKTDTAGNVLWSRMMGGEDQEEARAIVRKTDGGFAVAGWSGTEELSVGDAYLAILDSAGNLLSSNIYGGSNWDAAYDLQQTHDGGFVLAGQTESFGAGDRDFYSIRTNGNGDSLWTRAYGGSDYDGALGVIEAGDGSLVFGGWTNSFGQPCDMWAVATDPEGDTLWTRAYGGSQFENCTAIASTADGGCVLAGRTESFGHGSSDFYVVKTVPSPLSVPKRISMAQDYSLVAFPNPFNPVTAIGFSLPGTAPVELSVFDITGRLVRSFEQATYAAGEHSIVFDGGSLPSGVYMARLRIRDQVATRRLVLLR